MKTMKQIRTFAETYIMLQDDTHKEETWETQRVTASREVSYFLDSLEEFVYPVQAARRAKEKDKQLTFELNNRRTIKSIEGTDMKQIIELLERLGPSANSDWGLVQAAIAILEELDEPPRS